MKLGKTVKNPKNGKRYYSTMVGEVVRIVGQTVTSGAPIWTTDPEDGQMTTYGIGGELKKIKVQPTEEVKHPFDNVIDTLEAKVETFQALYRLHTSNGGDFDAAQLERLIGEFLQAIEVLEKY
jgi:hypothetical protein